MTPPGPQWRADYHTLCLEIFDHFFAAESAYLRARSTGAAHISWINIVTDLDALKSDFEWLNDEARKARREGQKCDNTWRTTAGDGYVNLNGIERLRSVRSKLQGLRARIEVAGRAPYGYR